MTLVNGFLTFVAPLIGMGQPPAYPEYLFFATIETVCTLVIIWQAWTWSVIKPEVS
jgi:membrane-associated phospholipid phosphatase